MDFNSRPHEEVDRQLRSIKCHRLHFNSRPREEVDISYCPRRAGLLLFQLTTSQGGRLIRSVNTANCLYFNSRPHEEVDRIRLFQTVESIISTHDLTKRSTLDTYQNGNLIGTISTHDLTKRSTICASGNRRCPCSFQLTTSRRGRQYADRRPAEVKKISTHDLTKRSTNGTSEKIRGRFISTHDLTKRSTHFCSTFWKVSVFQLTTSRRGRLDESTNPP